jgi:SAM-dependent methyltransferase
MTPQAPDFETVTARQQVAWSTGDFNRIAVSIMEVAEHLVATADPRPGGRVLDVACGSGNAALVAARRYCRVTGVDFAPNLLERGRMRAEAEGTDVTFVEGDAQALPFEDASFDTVLSVFGAMFAPDQERTAAELLRVCRPGGTVAMANWIPGSMAPALFEVTARFVPPPPGLPAPWRWGTEDGARELLGDRATVTVTPRTFYQRFPSAEAMTDLFKRHFGPSILTYRAIGPEREDELTQAMIQASARFDRADDGTLKLEGEYVEVVAVRA